MKKLFAIFLVVAVLFNSGGYALFFQYLINRSDSQVFDRINHNHYRSSDLVEVKVPVNFPAQATQEYTEDYALVSGQIQIKNDKYDFAEIKITRDTLYLRVIPNHELNKLVKANVLYGKLVNELPVSNTKHPNNALAKKSLSESILLTLTNIQLPSAETSKSYVAFAVAGILKPSLEVGGQPPEA